MASAEGPAACRQRDWQRAVLRLDLAPQVRHAALVLSIFADPDGTRVRPGVEVLAAITRASERSVIRWLNSLREIGLITRVKRGDRRSGKADEYQLSVPVNIEELLAADGALGPDWGPPLPLGDT